MANQISFTGIKVNANGVFYLEGEDLGESPAVMISSPVKIVTNPIRQVEKVGNKRYKVTASLDYAGNKVAGNAFASALSAATNIAAGSFLTTLVAWFKSLFSFNFKEKSKKKLLFQGVVFVAVLFGVLRGAEYMGFISPDTVPSIDQIADTSQKLTTEEGRKQVFNNHSFFESPLAKRYQAETGLDLDSVYATYSSTQIIRKNPVKMMTLDDAQSYCKNEIENWGARVPEMDELKAIMSNKTVAGKLNKKSAEWTATGAPGTWDDMLLYISESNFKWISQMFEKLTKAETLALDELGSGWEEGKRDGLGDSSYRNKLKKIALVNHDLPDKAEIEKDNLILDGDEKVWFRCIKDVPADEGVKMAQK